MSNNEDYPAIEDTDVAEEITQKVSKKVKKVSKGKRVLKNFVINGKIFKQAEEYPAGLDGSDQSKMLKLKAFID